MDKCFSLKVSTTQGCGEEGSKPIKYLCKGGGGPQTSLSPHFQLPSPHYSIKPCPEHSRHAATPEPLHWLFIPFAWNTCLLISPWLTPPSPHLSSLCSHPSSP